MYSFQKLISSRTTSSLRSSSCRHCRYQYQHYFSSFSSSNNNGMADEVNELITDYSKRPQTSVSLNILTRTGKGELLTTERNNKDDMNIDDSSNNTNSQFESQLQHHQYEYSDSYQLEHNSEASKEVLTQVASFVHHEMPIRLARRIKDLEKVPFLSQMPSVQSVKDIYISSFLTLVNEPSPREVDDSNMHNNHNHNNHIGYGNSRNKNSKEALFARKLELLYERHSSVLVQMARGAYELRDLIQKGEMTFDGYGDGSQSHNNRKVQFEDLGECHAFLDRFYMSRIGIRVLAGQYLALRQPHMGGYIGLICQDTSPYEIVKHAVSDAYYMCEQKYGIYPKVIIKGRLDLTFAYIPTQLHYIVLELLKNAMRATVEHHGLENSHKWPPVEVIIADGFFNEDVVIKIADEGGGIPRSLEKKIWSYLFTTADPSIQDNLVMQNDQVDHSIEAPLAGLGYGLPISKSYARYFGGDVSINSMEGYGTDAFIHLRRLGDSREPLPV